MIFLLFISLFLLLFLCFLVFKVDILSPTIILTATLMLSTGVLFANQFNWQVSISFKTYFVIILGLFFVLFGEVLGRFASRVKINSFINKNKKSKTSFKVLQPSNLFTSVVVVYMSLVLVWYYFNIKETVMLNNLDDSTLVGAYRSAEKDINSMLKLALIINLPIAYFYALSFAEAYVYKGLKVLKYLIPILIYFITSALSSGRMDVLYLLVSFVLFFFIAYQQKTEWRLKLNAFYFGKGLLIIVSILIVFYSLGFLTGKSNIHSFLYIISLYIGSPIIALDSFLANFTYDISNFGNETLIGVGNLMSLLGIESKFSNERILEFVHLGNMPSRTNIYTSFRRVINDYYYIGMIFYQFSIGFFFSYFYQKMKKNNSSSKEMMVFLYVYMFRYLVFQFGEERLLVNFFTITTLMQVSVFFILIRFFSNYEKS